MSRSPLIAGRSTLTWLAALVAAGALTLLPVAAGAVGPIVLYATGAGSGSTCTSVADHCGLQDALDAITPGSNVTIMLDTSSWFVGPFSLDARGSHVTLQPLSGAFSPFLSGLSTNQTILSISDSSSFAGDVTLNGLIFAYGGSSGVYGGAIATTTPDPVTVSNCTFGFNQGIDGGAINSGLGEDANLTVSDSWFFDNFATGNGAAIANGDGRDLPDGGSAGTGHLHVDHSTFQTNNAGGDGGAIVNGQDGGTGVATVATSTFSANSASGLAGAIGNADWRLYEEIPATGTLAVSYSTFSDNTAGNAGDTFASGVEGGNGHVVITRSTISQLTDPGGDGTALLGNSYQIAGSVVSTASPSTSCAAATTSLGDNYTVGAPTTCFAPTNTDQAGTSAQLGALHDNGGPTNTMLPADTSPLVGQIPLGKAVVINSTPVTLCNGPDQRGVNIDDACTIGAVDVALANPVTTPLGLVVTRQGTTVTGTWLRQSGVWFLCTLTYAAAPSGVTVRTTSNSCTFTGLSPSAPYGIRLVAINATSQSPFVFAAAPVAKVTMITCRKGHRVRHVTGVAPRCPLGFHRV